jgi:hypothetical protein
MSLMYHNQRCAQACISNDSVMRDVTAKTCDLPISILRVGVSRLCVSHVVSVTSLMFETSNYNLIVVVNLQIKSNSQIPFEFKSNSSLDLYLLFNSKSIAIQSKVINMKAAPIDLIYHLAKIQIFLRNLTIF